MGTILILLTLFTATGISSVSGYKVYKAKNGLTCFLCAKGYFFISDCIQNMTTAVCQPCVPGTFNSESGIPQSCSNCGTHCRDINSYIYKNCTTTENIKCECKKEYFKDFKVKGDETTWYCKPHSFCPPASGVEKIGTAQQDTVCKICTNGTYSNSSSRIDKCEKCTECQHLNEGIKCNSINDTVCVSIIDTEGHKDQRIVNVVLEVVLPVVISCILAFSLGLILFCTLRAYRNGEWCWRQQPEEFRQEEKNQPVFFIQMPYKQTTDNSIETGSAALVTDGPDDEAEYSNIVFNQETETTEQPTWDRFFCELSGKIISDWECVIRELFGEGGNNKIVEAKHNHQEFVKEQIYFCLNKWKESLEVKPSIEPVLNALKKHSKLSNKELDALQKKYFSL